MNEHDLCPDLWYLGWPDPATLLSMQFSSLPCIARCWSWMAVGPGFPFSSVQTLCHGEWCKLLVHATWYPWIIQVKWTIRHTGTYWEIPHTECLLVPGTVFRAIQGLLHIREAALYCTKQAVPLQDLAAFEDLEKWSNYRSLYHNKWQGKAVLECHIGEIEGYVDCHQIKRQNGMVESTWVFVGQTDLESIPDSSNFPAVWLEVGHLSLGALFPLLQRGIPPSCRVVLNMWEDG